MKQKFQTKRLALAAFGMGVLMFASQAFAADTTYKYDTLGRVVEVDYPDGSIIKYAYDAAGNRTQVTKTAGTAPAVVVLPLMGGVVVPLP